MNISFGTVLGIDIGAATVKIAELRFTFRNFELISYRETSYLTSEEGKPLISETLKSLISGKKLSRKKVIVSIPGNKVAFRTITFPFVEKKKIDSVINFEVENLLPFGPEEMAVDYAVLGKNGTTASVLCAAAEKKEIEALAGVLERAGIFPETVDVDLFGFFNTVRANFTAKSGVIMAVNLDTRTSSILILDKGRLKCVKAVDIGYEHLMLSEDDSSQVQLNPDKSRELLIELKRITRFMESEVGKIDGVYWCGKEIRGFSEMLLKEFDTDVRRWNPLNLKGLKKGGYRLSGDEHSSAVALGLCLRGSGRQFAGVDFKKSIYPERNFFHGISGNIKTSLVLSGAALLLFTFSLYFKQMTFENHFKELKAEGRRVFKKAVPEVKRVVNEVAQLGEKIERLNRDARILGAVDGSADSPINFLREISLRFPEKGTGEIYRYTFGKDDIRVEGLAASLKAVDIIKKKLSLVDGFSRIQVTKTKLASDKKSIDFKMILTFNAVKG